MSDDILALAQLLGCPTRLATLRAVGEGGLDVSELAARVGVTIGTASYHLGKLLEAGLVEFQRRGRRRVYGLGRRRLYFAVDEARQQSA